MVFQKQDNNTLLVTKSFSKKKLNQLTDDELIQNAQKGEEASFNELILRYEPSIFRFAMKFTKEEELAREVTQDVLLRLYTKLDTFEGRSSLSTWLYRVTFNSSFMLLRSLKKHKKNDSLEANYEKMEESKMQSFRLWDQPGDQLLERDEMREVMQNCLNELSIRHREILLMRDWEGLPNQVIADKLGISLMAAKSCLHRARSFFRELFEKQWEHSYSI